jgi:hypothetical protein
MRVSESCHAWIYDFEAVYLGCVVILYAMRYRQHVDNIVQIASVPYNPRTNFPNSLSYKISQVDSVKYKSPEKLQKESYDKTNPKEFAEMEWRITSAVNLVGDSSYLKKIGKQ